MFVESVQKYPGNFPGGVLLWSYSIKVAGLLSWTYTLLKKALHIFLGGGGGEGGGGREVFETPGKLSILS